ncbi:MAG: hypothetical protein RIS47_146 [Bacteroidota bacterium]
MKSWLIAIFGVLIPIFTVAQQVYLTDSIEFIHKIDKNLIQVTEAPNESFTINQLLQKPEVFEAHTAKNYLPSKSNVSAWAKVKIVSTSEIDRDLFLIWSSQSGMRINELEAYLVHNGQVHETFRFGYNRKASELYNTGFRDRFRFTMLSNDTVTIYLHLHNTLGYPPSFDLLLADTNSYTLYEQGQKHYHFLYFGALIVMILYNLLVYSFNRDKTYLYYTLYMISSLVYTLYFYRYIINFAIPEFPFLNAYFWLSSVGISTVFYYAFVRRFFNTPTIIPHWDRLIKAVMLIKVIVWLTEMIAYTLFQPVKLLVDVVNVQLMLEAVFTISLMVKLARNNKETSFFVLAGAGFLWSSLILTTILYTMGYMRAQLWFQTGAVLEILCYSAGLGYRSMISERDKINAQKQLYLEEVKNKRIQEEANQKLEQRIKERTHELSQTNDKLHSLNTELEAQKEEILSQNETLSSTLLELNVAHNQIQESIKYASRIQQSVMPPPHELDLYLDTHFMIFRPRDIVSGDFFWAKKIGNKTIVAIVDCTGHGVGGAILSILGISILNEIANAIQLGHLEFSPTAILDRLRQNVKMALHHGDYTSREGMDVSLCIIDKDSQQIHFAGAHNNLLMIRSNELIVFKGDQMPIGQYIRETPFTTQSTPYETGDMIYMYTDGITDQFGGALEEKFKSHRLRDLVYNIRNLTLADQKTEIERKHETWRKGYKQLDDILLIGMRL